MAARLCSRWWLRRVSERGSRRVAVTFRWLYNGNGSSCVRFSSAVSVGPRGHHALGIYLPTSLFHTVSRNVQLKLTVLIPSHRGSVRRKSSYNSSLRTAVAVDQQPRRVLDMDPTATASSDLPGVQSLARSVDVFALSSWRTAALDIQTFPLLVFHPRDLTPFPEMSPLQSARNDRSIQNSQCDTGPVMDPRCPPCQHHV